MSYLSKLRVARAIFDAADRISSSVTAACVVAALLGPTLRTQPDGMAHAFWGGAVFLVVALVAGIAKSMLDSLITKAEADEGGDS
ncbi:MULTISPECIES: hypothetical protein [unclassified Modicisalibacter]|uniref:hypothetical protein n=1 Tax=unclassified Modicisalibacter TaxID=2679913 RepID=UPI001CC966F8|nr:MULTISPECIES: hypothetical protein [unclassified Modicisalibacter]MBZ9559050.1 hypothetical protein [Modicisalibacter sp. R2A 31.J]MBZ9576839.1 hypothetical protein [Modicisalibacter sp. MOD 31.J]